MLPFQKERRVAGLIMEKRKANGSKMEMAEGGEVENSQPYPELNSCMVDLIKAIHENDSVAAAQAFYQAFEICESYPHEETSEQQQDNSYDAMNALAARNLND